jgi:hypothetical protein
MFIAILPSTPDLERSGIEHREPARPVSVAIAQHADYDVVARHAMDRVRARIPGLRREFGGLDHLFEPWPPRVVGNVHDVDPGGAKARHD